MRRMVINWIISIGLTFLLRKLKRRRLDQIRYMVQAWTRVGAELGVASTDLNVTVAEAAGVLYAVECAIEETRKVL